MAGTRIIGMLTISPDGVCRRLSAHLSKPPMPIDLIWEPQGLCKVYRGHVTARELQDSVNASHADPRFDHIRFQISDLLQVESYELRPDAVDDASAHGLGAMLHHRPMCMAYAATQPGVRALVERVVAMMGSVIPMAIFDNMDEARAWAQATAERLERGERPTTEPPPTGA